MSRRKVEISTGISTAAERVSLAQAIAGLRRKAGLTQYEMALRLGTRERNVQRWESGDAEPSGTSLIKMMRMCPDRESLEEFGVLIPPGKTSMKIQIQEGAEASEKTMGPTQKAREIRRLLKEVRGLAAGGDRYAKESLESIEEELIRGAGIATQADIPKGRRKEELRAAIKRIAAEKMKAGRSV